MKKALAVLLAVCLLVAACLCFSGSGYALAASYYSDVLEDLEKDEDFNPDDYTVDNSDYNLYVIQVAESAANELFVYVYQPYQGTAYDMTATSITIARTPEDTSSDTAFINSFSDFNNYDVELLSTSGVFRKYLVEGLTVSSDEVRYYNISEIFRVFNWRIDTDTSDAMESTEQAIGVAQVWTATDYMGDVYYYMIESQVVTVTSKLVSYTRIIQSNDSTNGLKASDDWFIAFNTDWDIDYIYEADIYYTVSKYVYKYSLGDYECESETNTTTIYDSDTYDTTISSGFFGLFGKQVYSIPAIKSVSGYFDYLDSTGLPYTCYADFSDYSYVITFLQTDYYFHVYDSGMSVMTTSYYSLIDEAAILRLCFESEGQVYNLGVVDNKTPGTVTPAIEVDGTKSGQSCEDCSNINWWLILVIVIVVVLLIIFWPYLPYLFKFIWMIISAPFRFIRWCYRKVKAKADEHSQKKLKKKYDDSSISNISNSSNVSNSSDSHTLNVVIKKDDSDKN